MNTDGTIIIYYENIRIIKLTPADASTVNINLTALANSYINFMKQVFNQ
ncbi:hypothetical protein [Pectinatus sottacetonis]|nr:hypothetical protein [Pectinatus sottacetonis]